MTAPKPGDRVRVEYEATYEGPWSGRAAGGGHIVRFAIPGDDGFAADIPGEATLTVLPKPLRVGDKVRLGVDPEPPIGAVLVIGKDGAAVQRGGVSGRWSYASATTFTFGWHQFAAQREVATVVWLPEVAS